MAIVPPGNKQIGDYTNIVVTSLRTPTVNNLLQTGFIVTKHSSPGVFHDLLTASFVVTKDTSIATMRNLLTVGFVVTREFTPRVETPILNLKYNTPGELTFT